MVHEGVMRRSDDEFAEVTKRGMSPAVCMLMFAKRDVKLVAERRFVGETFKFDIANFAGRFLG